MGERHELPDRERTVDRHEALQAVLEAPRLIGGGRARQLVEPGVDLERVGGDRDRILPAVAE
jgi:hypothetical protein